MRFVDRCPGRRVQIGVQPGQDDTSHRSLRHRRQHGRRRLDCARRSGRDHGPLRRMAVPSPGQHPQQLRPSPGRIDQPHRLQPLGPGMDRQTQEGRRRLPVLGHVLGGQGGDPFGLDHLLDVAGIQKGSQAVGQLQRPHRRHAGRELLHDHPRHLEPARQGRDGRRQVQTQVARRERRLVLLQIAQRPHLGQQHRPVTGLRGQRRPERPRRAPVGQQEGRVRQGLRRMVPQPVQHTRRQIVEEGPMRGDHEPARRVASKGIEGGHARPNRTSASSLACGSPTCIQSPSRTQP